LAWVHVQGWTPYDVDGLLRCIDAWLVVGQGGLSPVLAWVRVQGWTPYGIDGLLRCIDAWLVVG
jgi:hypothetical protein